MGIAFNDASSQYLEVNNALGVAYPFSVSLWFQSDDLTILQGAFWIGDKDSSNNWHGLLIRGDQVGDILHASSLAGGAAASAATTSGYSSGVWHNAVAVFNSDTDRRIFIDGGSKGTETTSRTPAGLDRISLGRLGDSTPGNHLSGKLAHVAIWSIALSDANALSLATDAPDTVEAGNLVEYWPLVDETDLTGTVASTVLTAVNSPTGTDDPLAAAGTLTITSPVDYQTIQRDGSDEGDIPITGTYTGSPTAIEASFNGGAYATIDASPAGGAFSGTLSNQDAGRGTLTVRFTNDTGVSDTVANYGIGDVFLWIGQSNQSGRFTNGQAFTGGTGCSVYDEGGTWANLGSNYKDPDESLFSVLPKLASLIVDHTSVPAAFICQTTGGTGLVASGGDWASGGGEFIAAMATVADSEINAAKLILFYQGETDAANGVAGATYATALSDMLDDMQADEAALAGVKLLAAIIGEGSTATSDESSAIQQGILSAIVADADILAGPPAHDQNFADDLHWSTDAQATTLAARWWRCIKHAVFSGTEDARGPNFSSATFAANLITVTLTGGVTPIVNGTNTTGWSVTDGNGARTVSSAMSSGLRVVLACDATLVAPVTVSYGDGEGAIGTTTADSGTLAAFPIEPFVDQAAGASAAGAGAFVSSIIGGNPVGVM